MATIRIRGVEFSPVMNAAGARGFFGEGYWFHWLWRVLTLGLFNWVWTTFVAKTVTFHPRAGNMPLKVDGLTPLERFPKCIYLGRAHQGVTLNAVGLSNRGFVWTLAKGRWQKRGKPFFISFMPVGATAEERREELRQFLDELAQRAHSFRAPLGLQLNISCPNTGHKTEGLAEEAYAWLHDVEARPELYGMVVFLKANVFLSPEEAVKIGRHPRLDGIVCSNTVPWKDLSAVGIDPEKVFGTAVSPLAEFGGGGFSGPQMIPVVCRWITELRSLGFTKIVIGENGIRRHAHAIAMLAAGADGVGLGSMAMTRPWIFVTTIAVHAWLAKHRRRS